MRGNNVVFFYFISSCEGFLVVGEVICLDYFLVSSLVDRLEKSLNK